MHGARAVVLAPALARLTAAAHKRGSYRSTRPEWLGAWDFMLDSLVVESAGDDRLVAFVTAFLGSNEAGARRVRLEFRRVGRDWLVDDLTPLARGISELAAQLEREQR